MKTKVSFVLPAEYAGGAHSGIVLGEFNDWNVETGAVLERKEDGSLAAEVELTPGRTYQYKYLLSDGRWVNDNSGRYYAEHYGNTVENSIVEVPLPPKKEKTKTSTKAVKPKVKVEKKSPKVEKDDLTKIVGVNKKAIALLNHSSVFTFKELGKCTAKQLQLILADADKNTKFKNPATWSKQAKLAAAGKWQELEALQKTLKV